MVQGKNSKSYKKKNTSDQNQPHTGFKNLVFGHQFASAGETIIPFNSLVQPTDWPQAGLVNPNAQTLLAAQLQLLKDNITVTSSARGLIQKSEYIVRANAIEFLNIESLANEAFEVEVADLMITGNLIVDLQTIRIQGELQDTETDFNMGYAFDVLNEEIIVFRNGVQLFRSDNNDSSGTTGNYYYLNEDENGKSSIIRFFEAATWDEPILIATTGGVVDNANVSTFQQIEHLAGQLDAIVPTVAALAGVPETNFRSGPNNVDLTQFGNKVLQNENDINTINNPFKQESSNGYVELPGGILLQWGNIVLPGTTWKSGADISFNIPFSTLYNVTATAVRNDLTTYTTAFQIDNGNSSNSSFRVWSSIGLDAEDASTSLNLNWFAIGKK